jgi:hypothetical protein
VLDLRKYLGFRINCIQLALAAEEGLTCLVVVFFVTEFGGHSQTGFLHNDDVVAGFCLLEFG